MIGLNTDRVECRTLHWLAECQQEVGVETKVKVDVMQFQSLLSVNQSIKHCSYVD